MSKPLRRVDLDDKYALASGEVFLSGIQALVRLPMVQRRRDLARGKNTAGFVSGYRGSPLGGYDFALWQAKRPLTEHHIRFEPGLNEDLAATAVWGSQQTGILGPSPYDGVFGIWYGKNPGVDRSIDALKHANYAGTSPWGGVLAISGDDPGATSSSTPNQSEQAFMAAFIPVLYPAGIDEFLDFGLFGFALSRFSGLWIAMKTVADTVESTGTVAVDDGAADFVLPNDFSPPPEGLHLRWPDDRWSQDTRVQNVRLPAALAFARANAIDRLAFGASAPRFGIVAAGKAYLDTVEALGILGIDAREAARLGLGVFKVGMVWPLEPGRIRTFAEGLEEVLVVEERRPVIESQLKEQAYGWPTGRRPRIVGKTDDAGAPLLPPTGEFSGLVVARAIARRFAGALPDLARRLAAYEARRARATPLALVPPRIPHFCAGCPHARSTKLPEGSRALAGIGCHSLAIFNPASRTATITQMGGEGANWIGAAPFVDMPHIFQNMGDGTYFHSGLLSIRAAVAARATITFKILVNDAVAMTGGQPVEGAPDAARITRQLHAEGVRRIAVVADDPDKFPVGTAWAPGTTIDHRDRLIPIETDLKAYPGVSVIVYDQVCATELRRRRKRGQLPAPVARPFINELVCEGCGDCVEKSGCAAVQPVETPFGRKKRIEQSSCNVDLSCLRGFCPSFVTIEGGRPRRPDIRSAISAPLPAPEPRRAGPAEILVVGVGGTGVITVGALLGMAAHLESLSCTVLDNTGMARKGGGISTHVRIGEGRAAFHAPRIGEGRADVVLGCDLVVTAGPEALLRVARGQSRIVLNDHPNPTAAQLSDPDSVFDRDSLRRAVEDAAGEGATLALDATALAVEAIGDAIYANVLLLGVAAQRGLLPVSVDALERAIEINGTNARENLAAFRVGRRWTETTKEQAKTAAVPETLDQLVERRAAFLTDYQERAYAERYRRLVSEVRATERRLGQGDDLTRAAALNYFRLLAFKDEYEVARLHVDHAFRRAIAASFEGDYRIAHHLAPPLLAQVDPETGEPIKRRYGAWIVTAFRILASLKGVRGTVFDIFGRTEERRAERRLIVEYEATIRRLLDALDGRSLALAVEIARVPEKIRGFGPVKAKAIEVAKAREAALLSRFGASTGLKSAAE
jgi:indolepyruvate ferredoxin oxidoreductase